MNLEARVWFVGFHAAAALDSFLFFMSFGSEGLTSRPSPGVSSALGVGPVLGLTFAKFSSFSRPTDALLNLEPGGGQGNLATHTVAQDCVDCVLFIYLFIKNDLCHAFSAKHPPPSRDCR